MQRQRRSFSRTARRIDADMVIISIGEKPVLDFLPAVDQHRARLHHGERPGPDLGREGLRHRRRDQAGPRDPCHRPGQGCRGRDQRPAHEHRLCARRAAGDPLRDGSRPSTTRSAGSTTSSSRRRRKRTAACPAAPAATAACASSRATTAPSRERSCRTSPSSTWWMRAKCIGCGFCAGICPCGVWEMVENV